MHPGKTSNKDQGNFMDMESDSPVRLLEYRPCQHRLAGAEGSITPELAHGETLTPVAGAGRARDGDKGGHTTIYFLFRDLCKFRKKNDGCAIFNICNRFHPGRANIAKLSA